MGLPFSESAVDVSLEKRGFWDCPSLGTLKLGNLDEYEGLMRFIREEEDVNLNTSRFAEQACVYEWTNSKNTLIVKSPKHGTPYWDAEILNRIKQGKLLLEIPPSSLGSKLSPYFFERGNHKHWLVFNEDPSAKPFQKTAVYKQYLKVRSRQNPRPDCVQRLGALYKAAELEIARIEGLGVHKQWRRTDFVYVEKPNGKFRAYTVNVKRTSIVGSDSQAQDPVAYAKSEVERWGTATDVCARLVN
ncbi:hypothetical protein FRC03_010774 [Tulasnella sp. 419]|nr:hypothetical protein FRC03_010774 [Tulasnella sp. 419]